MSGNGIRLWMVGIGAALALLAVDSVVRLYAGDGLAALELVAFTLLVAGTVALIRDRRLIARNQADRLIKLWRGTRHSLLNHLQVISGWLQLERPDRAAGYIQSVTDRVGEQRAALTAAGPAVVEQLFVLMDCAEAVGIQSRFVFEPGFGFERDELPQLLTVLSTVAVTVDSDGRDVLDCEIRFMSQTMVPAVSLLLTGTDPGRTRAQWESALRRSGLKRGQWKIGSGKGCLEITVYGRGG